VQIRNFCNISVPDPKTRGTLLLFSSHIGLNIPCDPVLLDSLLVDPVEVDSWRLLLLLLGCNSDGGGGGSPTNGGLRRWDQQTLIPYI
jgi:hypothetical protein